MSSTYGVVPTKIDFTPRRHHGYAVVLFIMGTLLPPLAVAARFGIGKDFWINLVLTICGYIPGHGHNFYIQNIRNNKNHARTPKWIQKYGLVDTSEIKRKERKSQWARRYNDRLPTSTLEGQPYEEGQEGASSVDLSEEGGNRPRRQPNGDLWRPEDEHYYNADKSANTSSSGRWHYPANFEDAEPLPTSTSKTKKKKKKDRWERTQDAYSMASEADSGKKKKRRKRKNSNNDDSISNRDDEPEFPEDAEGGLYGDQRPTPPDKDVVGGSRDKNDDDVFRHEF